MSQKRARRESLTFLKWNIKRCVQSMLPGVPKISQRTCRRHAGLGNVTSWKLQDLSLQLLRLDSCGLESEIILR